VERGSRDLQFVLKALCERVRAPKHTTRGPSRVLERRHGLAEIVERGAVGVEEGRPEADWARFKALNLLGNGLHCARQL